MNFTRNKMILYMLIIATGIDFILPWPVIPNKADTKVELVPATPVRHETRFSRQVVQPTWLNIGQEAPTDPTVYVNPRALEEAEEIRRTIQKAVEEDTYAVADPPSDPNMPDQTPPPSMHALPNWYVNMQKLWQNWSQNLFRGFRL
ncbi:uncharacterized protein LOC119608622 [Lucilia sericata]|uniref:uncharacterized protein LOC119608622 n=1 Tax=Lucilia sericata TaxID=13632 RepID=UPI0018A7FB45|nr:uncharacterized protein LOC119608622 [Lucilia sericata]